MSTTTALITGGNVFTLFENYDTYAIALLSKFLYDVKVGIINTVTREFREVVVEDHHGYNRMVLDVGDYVYNGSYDTIFNKIEHEGLTLVSSSDKQSNGSPRAIITFRYAETFRELNAMATLFPGKFLMATTDKYKKSIKFSWKDIHFHPVKLATIPSPLCEFVPDDSDVSMNNILNYMYYVMGRFSELVSKGVNYNIKVKRVTDIRRLLSMGLYPRGDDNQPIDSRVIDMHIEGYPPYISRVWYGESLPTSDVLFSGKNINATIKQAIEECSSSIIKYISPDLVFKSMRPRTDMSIFKLGVSNTINTRSEGYIKDGEYFQLFPVTRYAQGMSKGLYYCDENSCEEFQYCGTFYYYEPESVCFLAVKPNRFRIYRNKLEAYIRLLGYKKLWSKVSTFHFNPLIYAQLVGILPEDMMMTPSQVVEVSKYEWVIPFEDMMDPMPDNISDWPKRVHVKASENEYSYKIPIDVPAFSSILGSMHKGYAPSHLDMYAAEDAFDQDICKAAREQGIDVIHLTNMIGSHQIVHEILDTRDRVNSFKSLVFLKEN